jgi:hypothetical protein
VPSPLQSALHVTLNRPRVLGIAAVAVAVEVPLRIALAFVHPVYAVLFPPVVSVVLFGATLPDLRAVVTDADTPPTWSLTARIRAIGPRLFGVAVVGHAVALVAGTGLFLVVDTLIRYAVYAVGGGPLFWPVVFVAPLLGVAVGTLLAWGVLVAAVAHIVDGVATSAALREAITARSARRTAGVLGLHAAGVVAVAVVVLPAFVVAGRLRSQAALLVAGGALLGLAGVFVLAFLASVHATLSERIPSRQTLPIRRVALAAVVCTALVVGASAVRLTETRPAPATDDLPEDPSKAYETALENTRSLSYTITHRRVTDNETITVTRRVDRQDRQYAFESNELTPYYAGSTVSYPELETETAFGTTDAFELGERRAGEETANVLPGYWFLADDPVDGDLGLPDREAGEWSVVDRTNGRLVLELTGGAAIDAAISGRPPDTEHESAVVRVTIDTDRGVVTGGYARLNLTGEEISGVTEIEYDVQTGENATVERPDELGPRTPMEWVWKLFAY